MRYATALRKSAFAPAALVAALASGCADAPIAGVGTESVQYAKLSGEELFRGLMLGDGAAAGALPEVWQNPAMRSARSASSAAELASQTTMQQYIMGFIGGTDPEFFERFRATMTSGNPVALRAAISDAGVRTRDALLSHPDPAVRAAATGTTGTELGDPEANCVVVIVAYAAVLVWDWYWGPDRKKGVEVAPASGLRQDEFIQLVAQRLHA